MFKSSLHGHQDSVAPTWMTVFSVATKKLLATVVPPVARTNTKQLHRQDQRVGAVRYGDHMLNAQLLLSAFSDPILGPLTKRPDRNTSSTMTRTSSFSSSYCASKST